MSDTMTYHLPPGPRVIVTTSRGSESHPTEREYWPAVTDVPCPSSRCAGLLRWAEAGYVPGYRICDGCRRHYLAGGTAAAPIVTLQRGAAIRHVRHVLHLVTPPPVPEAPPRVPHSTRVRVHRIPRVTSPYPVWISVRDGAPIPRRMRDDLDSCRCAPDYMEGAPHVCSAECETSVTPDCEGNEIGA